MDDLRVSRSARSYRHPSSVSGAGQSVMCWRGLVARHVLPLFLSECSLFGAREVDCEWVGAHDNDIIILKALIVPNTARDKERQKNKKKEGKTESKKPSSKGLSICLSVYNFQLLHTFFVKKTQIFVNFYILIV